MCGIHGFLSNIQDSLCSGQAILSLLPSILRINPSIKPVHEKRHMNTVCIGLGKHTGHYISIDYAIILAKTLVYNDFHLFYGGVDIGLLGVMANAELEREGRRMGIIPPRIVPAEAPPGQWSLLALKNNHDRIHHITGLTHAFIARAGGYARHTDIYEILSRARVDRNRRSIAFFTRDDYFRHTGQLLALAAYADLIRPCHRTLIVHEKKGAEPNWQSGKTNIETLRHRMA